jgi:hypothetical protein
LIDDGRLNGRTYDRQGDENMYDHGPLEENSQVFTGIIKSWRNDYGEPLTDSGVTVPFVTQGYPAVPLGTRVNLVARRYKPLFQIEKLTKST